jgi:hypothetical protein
MTQHAAPRRRFITLTVAGLAAVPMAALFTNAATAAEMVNEADPTAKSLNYSADGAKSTKRTDKSATCANCSLYSGKAGAADGPCTLFQGKSVSANGWCIAWVKKA